MCLSEVYDKSRPNEEEVTVYKIFKKVENNLYPVYFSYRCNPFVKKTWVNESEYRLREADVLWPDKIIYKIVHGVTLTYPAGFHTYVYEEDAAANQKYLSSIYNTPLVLKKVKIRNIVAEGIENHYYINNTSTPVEVIVAKEMFIPED